MSTLPSILLIIVLLHGGVVAAASTAQMSKHGLPGVALAGQASSPASPAGAA